MCVLVGGAFLATESAWFLALQVGKRGTICMSWQPKAAATFRQQAISKLPPKCSILQNSPSPRLPRKYTNEREWRQTSHQENQNR